MRTFRQWLQDYLGITDISNQLRILSSIDYRLNLRDVDDTNLRATLNGVARLLAKLDPIYGQSEFDPARIAASKKLEDSIIARLYGEAKEQKRYR